MKKYISRLSTQQNNCNMFRFFFFFLLTTNQERNNINVYYCLFVLSNIYAINRSDVDIEQLDENKKKILGHA